MGVPGLWEELHQGAITVSLTKLSLDAFNKTEPHRGFRLGIDASLWLFHAEGGNKDGKSPELRTIFFRTFVYLRSGPFLPVFVFDGPERPVFKRNQRGGSGVPTELAIQTKELLDALGIPWIDAPGEAEAELAVLNSEGLIDGVLSDDVDNFLFGARTVLRNPSNTLTANRANPLEKNYVRIYKAEKLPLQQSDMILIALMSGGDYIPAGVKQCGVQVSVALTKCGFGKKLVDAYKSMEPREFQYHFLPCWRADIATELCTNSQGFVGRKLKVLAKSIPDTFPDIPTLHYYVYPVTSRSRNRLPLIGFNRMMSIPEIASICEKYFEWGYLDKIIHRFRTLVWPAATMRILQLAISLGQIDSLAGESHDHVGQGGRMIQSHFGRRQGSIPRAHPPLLFMKIHSTRRHSSTENVYEYRVEIRPNVLESLAKLGLAGTGSAESEAEFLLHQRLANAEAGRSELYLDEAQYDDDDDETARSPKKKEPKISEPNTPLRLWMPASILEKAEPSLVKTWHQAQREKADKEEAKAPRKAEAAEKRLQKGTSPQRKKASPEKKKKDSPEKKNKDSPGKKKTTKTPIAPLITKRDKDNEWAMSSDDEKFMNSPSKKPSLPTVKPFPRLSPLSDDRVASGSKGKGKSRAISISEEDEDEDTNNSPSKYQLPPSTPSPVKRGPTKRPVSEESSEDDEVLLGFSGKSPKKSPRRSKTHMTPHRTDNRAPSPTPAARTPRPRMLGASGSGSKANQSREVIVISDDEK
ncbi:hypothetical protein C8J56DRAFT_972030 [Mycena floridula]|nr:hypothetical protein C8J56DRAFT_972030 [Mycena floridula]